MKRILHLLILLLIVSHNANAYEGEEPSFFAKGFHIKAGAAFPNFNTDGRLDGDNGLVGTDIDFENLLGLDDDKVTPFAEAIWRINPKHRLKFGYVNLDRDGSRNLSTTINFDETTFTAGLNVDSEINLSIYRVGYDYSFVNDGQKEFGMGLDVDIMDIDFSISALGGTSDSESVIVPAPTIGFHGAYALNEKLALVGIAKGLYFDVDTAKGSVINAYAGVEHDTFKSFSTGVGYSYYDVDLDIDGSGVDGTLDMSFHGPMVYGKLHF